MRFILLFLISSFIFAVAFSQESQPVPALPIDPDTKLIQYREVIPQEGTKDVLYDRGIEWFRAYYLSPTSVFRVQDKVNGKIEGTGRFKIYFKDETGMLRDAGVILYDIRVELKDNKYRYTLTEFNYKTASRFPIEKWMNRNDPAYNSNGDLFLYQTDTTMQGLIRSLKEGMKPKVIKKDEW
jgi:hypothetical protein